MLGHQVGWVDNSGFDDNDFLVVGGSPDTDTDGIPDSVERFGVRKSDGTFGFRPQDYGASPCRPTVFVKADFMAASPGVGGHFHNPTAATMQLVKAGFDKAPRQVPKCPYPGWSSSPGVQLVLLPGEELTHRDLLSPSGDDKQIDKDVSDIRDGTNNNGNNPGGTDRLPDDWRPFVHYALFAHKLVSLTDDYGGLAVGKDFMVSLGNCSGAIDGPQGQAATFMHELGHALGLGHGGFEDVNFKPNYVSPMNYAFPLGLLPGQRLDFSAGTRGELNQEHLNEATGIGDASVTTGFYTPGNTLVYGPGGGPLNSNGGDNGETDVAADINGDNGGTCVSAGSDGVLSTQPAPTDRKAVPPQAAVNPTPVVHAGPDYICDTTPPAARMASCWTTRTSRPAPTCATCVTTTTGRG